MSTGWVCPNGELYPCQDYNHLEEVAKIPGIRKLIPEYDDLIAGVEAVEQGCQSLIDIGEHPEWHHYEMTLDDARYQLYVLMIRRGFMRYKELRGEIFFGGTSTTLKSNYQRCKDIAEGMDCTATFEPQFVSALEKAEQKELKAKEDAERQAAIDEAARKTNEAWKKMLQANQS